MFDSEDNMVRWYKRSIFIKNDQNGSKSKSNKKKFRIYITDKKMLILCPSLAKLLWMLLS